MAALQNKIDFVVLVAVNKANANGDPLNGNRPRTDYNGFGEISDVCIKRKIRNRMQDMGYDIFVQSDERKNDEYKSLSERVSKTVKTKDPDEFAKAVCENWLDVRTFGQVFAFKDKNVVSMGIRGPVSIHQGVSISPVEVRSYQITKSVNGDPTSGGEKSSDTMGQKHFVEFGIYKIKGSINVQLAEKTGFSHEDAEVLKECLRTLFVNDASSARPDGSMEVLNVYWWEHNNKEGQYSAAQVHRSVKVEVKEDVKYPAAVEDYTISVDELSGLKVEVLLGV